MHILRISNRFEFERIRPGTLQILTLSVSLCVSVWMSRLYLFFFSFGLNI